MVQGKFKKAALPKSIQKKQKQKQKGVAFTRRPNAPIQSKKAKFTENQKIKTAVSKVVNKSVESELRARACEGQINLSKAQKEVAKHHKNVAAAAAAASLSTSSNAPSTSSKA